MGRSCVSSVNSNNYFQVCFGLFYRVTVVLNLWNKKAFQWNANRPLSNSPCFTVKKFGMCRGWEVLGRDPGQWGPSWTSLNMFGGSGLCMRPLSPRSPPLNGQTECQIYMTENITFATSLAGSNNVFHSTYTSIFTTAFASFFRYDRKTLSCVWDRTADFSYSFSAVGVAFPVILISICCIKIFLHVRASKTKVKCNFVFGTTKLMPFVAIK